MKTPREILMERHRAINPKLDSIRHEIINSKFSRENFLTTIWRELIFPSRRIWAGLAIAWILIAMVNISFREQPQASVAKISPTPEMILAFRQEKKLLNELIGQNESQPVEPPRVFAPR